jgi:glycerophosphoryl diester phosphodiesterase/protein tyrosine/serine phosphatase
MNARALLLFSPLRWWLISIASAAALTSQAAAPAESPIITRFQDPRPIIVAHRGCWRIASEDSLSGIKACVERGIDIVETDVRASKDGELFLLHDDTLDRTTNLAGPLKDHTSAELKTARLRTGAGGKDAPVTDEPLPGLVDALRAAKGRVLLILDIKDGSRERVYRTVEQEGAQDWVIFFGDRATFSAIPDWARRHSMWTAGECAAWPKTGCFSTLAEAVPAYEAFQPLSIALGWKNDAFVSNGAAAAARAGVRLGSCGHRDYTGGRDEANPRVNRATVWRDLLELGVDVLCTDYPIELSEYLISRDLRAAKTNSAEAATADHVRRLPLEGATNFRDLGGYAAADGKRVRWGLLYRSDALDTLTAADMDLVSGLNVTRVTDFRSPGEVARRPDRLPAQLAARQVHLPIDDTPARADPETAKKSAEASAAFRAAMTSPIDAARLQVIDRLIVDYYYPRLPRHGRTAYREWLHGLLDGPKNSAQIFHCTGGADRTGFAAAILLLTLGVPRETVIDDYLMTNDFYFSAEAGDFRKQKKLNQMPPDFRLHARYLEAAFRSIETDYGSIENYIRYGLEIDDVTRHRLRERYLE